MANCEKIVKKSLTQDPLLPACLPTHLASPLAPQIRSLADHCAHLQIILAYLATKSYRGTAGYLVIWRKIVWYILLYHCGVWPLAICSVVDIALLTCVVDNFRQFVSNVADVWEVTLLDELSYSDGIVLDVLKFAEQRVNGNKGKAKRMTKGQKHSSVMQVVPWVSVARRRLESFWLYHLPTCRCICSHSKLFDEGLLHLV